jgi:hypothetical protein
MTNKEISEKIRVLLAEYNTATSDRQAVIQKDVKALYQQLPQRPGYCRNCNMRKMLPEGDDHWPFCGEPCHKEYGEREYGPKKEKGRPKTMAEMRKR